MLIFPTEGIATRKAERQTHGAPDAVKRAIDVTGSFLGLIVMLPVFAIIAAAIKLDSRGPVLYKQERVGMNRRRNGSIPRAPGEQRRLNRFGRPFTVFKFRSMVTNAEGGTGPVWAKAADDRITRVGRILRKTRLDEFPQLWNVLRGDMSLVGPRPERFFFVEKLDKQIPGYKLRCDVLPGLTGLAQVKHGYDSSIDSATRKLQYDLYYLQNRRLLLDLKIMAETVKVMASGEGAH
jgi:lipopolysaccharide/colanic/teichoic acid biosynthesis glycosyltransferase